MVPASVQRLDQKIPEEEAFHDRSLFLTALAEDAAAPRYRRRTLQDYFLSKMQGRTAPETP
ncbi:MAG: hypothetical protein P1P77_02285 [Spirochaetaceae bacterium]|nr:hypothetical protein [Spirochaetaceae bacterium]